MTSDYDDLADIYDLWAEADVSAAASLSFYVERMREPEQGRVELGIGTGRVAIPVLQEGGCLTGVDVSSRMLEVCRTKAERAGVADALCLIQQDVRELELDAAAELVIFPFRSIGHLLSEADKLACFRSVYANLVPGGRFVFDHYIWNEAWARSHDGVPIPMVDQDLGEHRVRIFDLYQYRYDDQRMDCSVRIERVGLDGRLIDERVHRFEFSWFNVDQVCRWAEKTGFEVEAVYGSFESREAVSPQTVNQIWTLRRPVTS
jgi:SAM-dependent methyltransferase